MPSQRSRGAEGPSGDWNLDLPTLMGCSLRPGHPSLRHRSAGQHLDCGFEGCPEPEPPSKALPGFLTLRVLVPDSRPTLSDPRDCSLPGSSVQGILLARVLEWAAISFSRGSS